MSLEIVVLVDNDADDGLMAEHGLSLLLRGAFGQVLMDTGASAGAMVDNAAALDVDLTDTWAAVLTHGHYDHAGGLAALATRVAKLKLYCHPGAFEPRYVEKPQEPLRPWARPSVWPGCAAWGWRSSPWPTPCGCTRS